MITSSFDEFVEDNISLALRVAKRYTRAFPNKYDDIRSVALVALVKACRDIENGKPTHDNYPAYLTVKVRGEILRFINRDSVVRKHKVIPIIDNITTYDDSDEENLPDFDTEEGLIIDLPILYSELVNDFYLHLTEEEKNVLNYRLQEYTLDEIAGMVGHSRCWVELRCNSIKDKYSRGRYS